ncbi:hypothetical protein TRVL_01783 [Trypanosoma vivax]|nr:hypothetical protein TRVL_01783 [Trypanosoma vivax]
MTLPDDIGLELCVLACHLYRKHRGKPQRAFYELALRTRCGSHDEFAQNLSALSKTRWYHEMQSRYTTMRQCLRDKHGGDIEEAREMTRSLYPRGCQVGEYVDAISTCAAMLSSSIPSKVLDRFTVRRVQELGAQGLTSVTADELVNDLVEGPMLDSMIPTQWWKSTGNDGVNVTDAVVVKAVALRAEPMELVIFYTRFGKTRRRRIPLAGLLHENGSTAPLLKRLLPSHGSLLDESQLRTYLQRMQTLSRKVTEAAISLAKVDEVLQVGQCGHDHESNVAAILTSSTVNEEKPTAPRAAAVNKADVGLLYRDPDAALNNVDLNDADDITLQEFKAKMEERFMENVIRPGDPGYVYDKRLEVNPTERSEWDDSD